MIKQKLDALLQKRCTILGVGPVSLNCINAVIELANEQLVPIILIASRGQIDSKEFNGGYVNNWTTTEFANYVIDNDKNGRVILARDHGGPWQNPKEKDSKLSLRRAMESAKKSFKTDIEAGFQIIHIDPSIDIHGNLSTDEVLDRVFELYEYCWAQATKLGSDILFEIGTEKQTGCTNTQEELEYILSSTQKFCKGNNLPFPSFVVTQIGTRVVETRNVGSFDSPIRVLEEIPSEIQVPKMIEICNRYKILMKVHNTDYLSDEALKWYPRLGIHSANVAPEFGVVETRALIKLMEQYNLIGLKDDFIKLSYTSGQWRKWVLPNNSRSEMDCAIISGHYVFSTDACKDIKCKIQSKIDVNLENFLKDHIKKSILRYLNNFQIVGTKTDGFKPESRSR